MIDEKINYQLQVPFKLWVNRSNLQTDIPVIQVGKKFIRVDPLMLQVTKKIRVDENIMSQQKYYELIIELQSEEN